VSIAVANLKVTDGDEDSSAIVVPQRGQPASFYWPNNSRLAADHVAAGSFDSAFRILEETLGIINLEPYKQLFMLEFAKY
jgi:coatomer protein complex subunit alpha (xenin)